MIARLFPILAITFIDILGFSILIPILPYFVKEFGAADVVVGLLFATFAFCQLIAGPVWGNVSDRIGRKNVLIVSQIGATIGWTMLGFAHSLVTVFAARIVEGISGGNISVTQAYVADLVEPAERPRAFAYIGAAFSGGIVFGPVLGALFYNRYGFSAPFFAAAGLQIITLIATVIMLPESRAADQVTAVAGAAEIGASLRDRRIAPVLWQKLAYAFALYAWFAVFTLFLKDQLHFDAAASLYFFTAFGLVSIVMQIGLVGKVNDALGNRGSSNVGLVGAVLFFALVPFLHSVAALAPALVLFAFALAIVNPGITSILTDATPQNQRGTILGVGSSLESVAGIVTPPISTAVLGSAGAPWSTSVSLFFSLVALAMGLKAQRAPHAAAVDPEPA